MSLSNEIQDRVHHVLEYHRASKHTREAVSREPAPDLANQPAVYRIFQTAPKVPLPTNLMDCSAGTLELSNMGLEALPDSYVRPPQNLKTLASWLFYAAGITKEFIVDSHRVQRRSAPSSGAMYPCEIYVAAFGIEGLEPGLYHFSVKEFALRKLREGPETLWQLKRGRPDLELLKTVPAALLVSTNFWRSAWMFNRRAYREAVLDAGHQTENLCIAARGLGIQTMVRLWMNDSTMRELIGIPPEPDFGTLEPVQSMVVWADQADHPLELPKLGGALPTLPPIDRAPLSPDPLPYGSIAAVHMDCTAPGVAIREIRPPLTELTPLPPTIHVEVFEQAESQESLPLRKTLLSRRTPRDYVRRSITRDAITTLTRVSFRGGSYFPVFPDGPHLGLVRAFWLVHDVIGLDPGVWYYHPPTDGWSLLRIGHWRGEARHMAMDQNLCGNCAAVCWIMSNVSGVMSEAGPDAYRIAHLEAGIVGQRMAVAGQSIGLPCAGVSSYYDDEVRTFLGIARTSWEIIYGVAVGHPAVGE